ncbi:unnamed protein product [Cylindrotheca closterium]|uniref:Uncharacterized protein n=1 Tax=Cylindrotheca closterium TaxID=2856 RepID=A0AAD2G6M6_9STRA|nr:unnamed protein product [Cylindrotheca closterium]
MTQEVDSEGDTSPKTGEDNSRFNYKLAAVFLLLATLASVALNVCLLVHGNSKDNEHHKNLSVGEAMPTTWDKAVWSKLFPWASESISGCKLNVMGQCLTIEGYPAHLSFDMSTNAWGYLAKGSKWSAVNAT